MSKRLFVGNLPFSTTKEELLTFFAAYDATDASIPTDHDGRSKGFAFVDVADEMMNAAIEATNGKELGGRAINVNEARPREERAPRSGGFGGGNRDNYRGGGSAGGYAN